MAGRNRMIAEQKLSQKAWKLIRPRIQSSLIQHCGAVYKSPVPGRRYGNPPDQSLCVNWIFRFSHSRTELSCLSLFYKKGQSKGGTQQSFKFCSERILKSRSLVVTSLNCSVTRDQIILRSLSTSPLTCAFCEGLLQQVHLKCSEPSLLTLLCHVRGQEEVV